MTRLRPDRQPRHRHAALTTALPLLAGLAGWATVASAQQAPAATEAETPSLETVTVTGNWLGSGLQNGVKSFPGARTLLTRDDIEKTGAATIGDVMRRIPGVQATDNSGTAGSAISSSSAIRGSPRRTSVRKTPSTLPSRASRR